MTEEEKLLRKIRRTYAQASVETEARLNRYLQTVARNDRIWRERVERGEVSRAEYLQWRANRIAYSHRYEDLRDSLANDMLIASNTARQLTNDAIPSFIMYGLNHGLYEIEASLGARTGFTIYNREAVNYILTTNRNLFPPLTPEGPTARALREGRLTRWNMERINSQVTQAILQGLPLPEVAQRFRNVENMNAVQATRAAQTIVGAAINAGKTESYRNAEVIGIQMEKQWVATFDDRTRDTHRGLDGQIRPIDEPYEIDGYEIMFPKDPDASPEMVYNCRCTQVGCPNGRHLNISQRGVDNINGLGYNEWRQGRDRLYEAEDGTGEYIPLEEIYRRRRANG